MEPIRFEQANYFLRAPKGSQDVSDLHVFRDGAEVISCWQPNEKERAMIAAGAPIFLRIMGVTMPPVQLEVSSPFLTEEPDDLRREECEDGAPHCANCEMCIKHKSGAYECLEHGKRTAWHAMCANWSAKV